MKARRFVIAMGGAAVLLGAAWIARHQSTTRTFAVEPASRAPKAPEAARASGVAPIQGGGDARAKFAEVTRAKTTEVLVPLAKGSAEQQVQGVFVGLAAQYRYFDIETVEREALLAMASGDEHAGIALHVLDDPAYAASFGEDAAVMRIFSAKLLAEVARQGNEAPLVAASRAIVDRMRGGSGKGEDRDLEILLKAHFAGSDTESVRDDLSTLLAPLGITADDQVFQRDTPFTNPILYALIHALGPTMSRDELQRYLATTFPYLQSGAKSHG